MEEIQKKIRRSFLTSLKELFSMKFPHEFSEAISWEELFKRFRRHYRNSQSYFRRDSVGNFWRNFRRDFLKEFPDEFCREIAWINCGWFNGRIAAGNSGGISESIPWGVPGKISWGIPEGTTGILVAKRGGIAVGNFRRNCKMNLWENSWRNFQRKFTKITKTAALEWTDSSTVALCVWHHGWVISENRRGVFGEIPGEISGWFFEELLQEFRK